MAETNPIPAQEAKLRLIGSVARNKPAGLLSRLFWRGGMKAIIKAGRPRCCVVGVMVLVDKSIPLDGLVTDLDASGATFRPASIYILDRGRVDVLLRFADREVLGQISSVSPLGYDIVFRSRLDEMAVAEIMAAFGMERVDDARSEPVAIEPTGQARTDTVRS